MHHVKFSLLSFVSFILLLSCNPTKEKTVSSDSVQPVSSSEKQNTAAQFTYEVFSNSDDQGWGYDLYIDGKKSIHQPFIPAVSGNRGFATKEEAELVAQLAVKKLQSGMGLPTISLEELDSLKITTH